MSLQRGDSHHRQGKPQPEFVLQEDFHMVHSELLELNAAEVMDVGRMPFHLLQLEFHLGLRDHVLLIHANDARLLPECA